MYCKHYKILVKEDDTMRKITALLLALIMMLSLSACGECKHEQWNPATCTEPATCAECGEVSGEAMGHSWQEASCSAPETCYNCGETQGEALPHTYGAWEIGASDMSHTCSVCGESETLPLDYEIAVNSMLQGNWDFYYGVFNGTPIDCFSGFPGSYFRFDNNGTGTMYVPAYQSDGTVTEIAEYQLSAENVEYYSESNAYDFYLLAKDGSTVVGQLFVGTDGSLALNILLDESTTLILTKNYREYESLSGIWTAAENGELYCLELNEDGSLSGTFSGTWHPFACINSNGTWYTGFTILYKDGDVYRPASGQIWVCYEDQDVWEALGWGYGSNIGMYIGEEWLNFSQISAENYEELKAAHDEGAEKVVGTWDCDTASFYNSSTGETEEKNGEYSITFTPDGSVTSQLATPFESSWTYAGAEVNGSEINWIYNIMVGDYESSVRLFPDGTLYLGSLDGGDGYYYSYSFTTPEGRAKQEAAAQEAIDMITGTWSGSDVSIYDSSKENSEAELQTGDFSMSFNADGTVSAKLLDSLDGTWVYDGTSEYDGQTHYNYYIEKDGNREYFTIYENGGLSFSNSPDGVVWYGYFMNKNA